MNLANMYKPEWALPMEVRLAREIVGIQYQIRRSTIPLYVLGHSAPAAFSQSRAGFSGTLTFNLDRFSVAEFRREYTRYTRFREFCCNGIVYRIEGMDVLGDFLIHRGETSHTISFEFIATKISVQNTQPIMEG